MGKISCDIIRDLIPSYVDGICSDATREWVEEHLECCEGCRKLTTLCRENGISGEQLEKKELDGLKRIKQIIRYKGIACCGLAAFILVYLGIVMFLDFGQIPLVFSAHFHPVLCITCICLVLLSGMGFKGKKAPGRTEVISGIVSVMADFYILMINLYFLTEIRGGADRILGMELQKTGPFLTRQMAVGYLVMFGLFLWHLIRIIRQDRSCNWLLCLDVTGCYIILECTVSLHKMLNIDAVMQLLVRNMAEVGVVGLLGIGASVLIAKAGRQKRSEL